MKGILFYSGVAGFLLAVLTGSLFSADRVFLIVLTTLVLAAAILWYWKRYRWYMALAVCGICALVGFGRIGAAERELPTSFAPLVGVSGTVTGTVVALPDIRETNTRLTVELASGGETTRLIASAPSYPVVHTGDAVAVTGRPEFPKAFAGDGGRSFAYDTFLEKDGVFLTVQSAKIEVLGRDGRMRLRLLRTLEHARSTFTTSVAKALPEPESALAAGLIAGGKQGLGKDLIEVFTIAGLLQIVVLSGYNVMIIAAGIIRSLQKLPERVGAVVASCVIFLFVLAAGGGSPALRAGLMAMVVILARSMGKTTQVLKTLFATLILLLLWNPLLLAYDPGLQFSFLATLGLILGTPIVSSWLHWIRQETLREILASTLAAQIGVIPILLWQTGNLSLVSVVANVLVTPVIPFAMAASAVAALIAFLTTPLTPLLPLLVGIPAYASLTLIIHIAVVSASLPFAQVIIPAFPFWVVIVGYVLLGLYTLHAYKKSSKIAIEENAFKSSTY